MIIKEKVKRLKEECPWCNRKFLGKDEFGFICCVNCEYNSYYQKGEHKDMDYSEAIDRMMNIYDELVCSASNPEIPFTCVCNKLKGHKGKHTDKEHPGFQWEDSSKSGKEKKEVKK